MGHNPFRQPSSSLRRPAALWSTRPLTSVSTRWIIRKGLLHGAQDLIAAATTHGVGGPLRRLWKRLLSVALVLVGLFGTAGALSVALPAGSASAKVNSQETGRGFDDSTLPNTYDMTRWWHTTPLLFVGVYIGGSNFIYQTPTASWVHTVSNQGWDIEPVWVGPQDPCWPLGTTKFSITPSVAMSQGEQQEYDAATVLSNDGFGATITSNTTITYDMEYFGTTSGCIVAAESFIKGWDTAASEYPSQVAGVYGSTCASHIVDFTGSPPPYFVWPSWPNGTPSVGNSMCIPSGDWSGWQRIKQYAATQRPGYGGVTLKVDLDNAHAPAFFT